MIFKNESDFKAYLEKHPDLALRNPQAKNLPKRRPSKRKLGASSLEKKFLDLWLRLGGSKPLVEYRFASDIGRRWRIDFFWSKAKLGIEIEGLVSNGKGRHQNYLGAQADAEKYLVAQLHYSITILRLTPNLINSSYVDLIMDYYRIRL